MRQKIFTALIAVGILFLAAFFRLYGFNWDQNQHLHPDERFLTMVTNAISWPQNLYQYLNTDSSSLNPHNRGFGFFVYGTFPLFFTKWVAEYFKKGDYTNLTLVGRQLSALVDIGTVILVFLIGKQISTNQQINQSTNQPIKRVKYKRIGLLDNLRIGNWMIPLWGMFFYASMVLPIQLSHFYAVDTYLTFFITLSFYLLIKLLNSKNILTTYNLLLTTFLGISFGLALASKISAILFLPIILLGLTVYSIRYSMWTRQLILVIVFIISAFFTFRLAQPYLFAYPDVFDFTLNAKVLDNWKQLKSFDGPNTGFPPALQWIPTKPYIYPFVHFIIWGLGPVIGIISILAIIYQLFLSSIYLFRKKFAALNDNKQTIICLSLIWIILLFGYQAGQFAKALRYLYPISPFIALIAGISIYEIDKLVSRHHKSLSTVIICVIILTSSIWTKSFVFIYTRLHPRVSASLWIYKNIPPGSTIGNEHWDDPQPLYNTGGNPGDYKGVELTLYYPDSSEKWTKMTENLEKTDYIAVTSNRLWRSLTALPQKYPQTVNYYKTLFDGSLGFDTIAVFSSYPCLIPKLFPSAGNEIIEKTNLHPYPISLTTTNYCLLALNDDGAEESFTVYDHPKVIILKNNKHFSAGKLLNIITNTN